MTSWLGFMGGFIVGATCGCCGLLLIAALRVHKKRRTRAATGHRLPTIDVEVPMPAVKPARSAGAGEEEESSEQ